MTKKLLVLGASMYQIPVIQMAHQLGYQVLTTDNIADNPGHRFADRCFGIDTTDVDAVLALAKAERISGAISPGTDVAVLTVAHLAQALHLSGPTVRAARILTDKKMFRHFLAELGLPCPRVVQIGLHNMPEDMLFEQGMWLVKPNKSSGSKGIFIIGNQAEFQSHIAESLGFSLDGTAILEEFIQGSQHTCEGIVQNGKISRVLMTDRDTANAPYTTTLGHRCPSTLSSTLKTQVLADIETVLAHLDVKNGPFDCDFVVSGNMVYLLEMTPRLGGNSLSQLFHVVLDTDLIAYAVTYACGDIYTLPEVRSEKPAAIMILGVEHAGRLAWDTEQEAALRNETWLHTLSLDYPQGTTVLPFINGRHRVGEVLIECGDRKEIDARLTEVKTRLKLHAR